MMSTPSGYRDDRSKKLDARRHGHDHDRVLTIERAIDGPDNADGAGRLLASVVCDLGDERGLLAGLASEHVAPSAMAGNDREAVRERAGEVLALKLGPVVVGDFAAAGDGAAEGQPGDMGQGHVF